MPPVIGKASAFAVEEELACFLVDHRSACWQIGVDRVAHWGNLLDSEVCGGHKLGSGAVSIRSQRWMDGGYVGSDLKFL